MRKKGAHWEGKSEPGPGQFLHDGNEVAVSVGDYKHFDMTAVLQGSVSSFSVGNRTDTVTRASSHLLARDKSPYCKCMSVFPFLRVSWTKLW